MDQRWEWKLAEDKKHAVHLQINGFQPESWWSHQQNWKIILTFQVPSNQQTDFPKLKIKKDINMPVDNDNKTKVMSETCVVWSSGWHACSVTQNDKCGIQLMKHMYTRSQGSNVESLYSLQAANVAASFPQFLSAHSMLRWFITSVNSPVSVEVD